MDSVTNDIKKCLKYIKLLESLLFMQEHQSKRNHKSFFPISHIVNYTCYEQHQRLNSLWTVDLQTAFLNHRWSLYKHICSYIYMNIGTSTQWTLLYYKPHHWFVSAHLSILFIRADKRMILGSQRADRS